jgi:hypothetical protein
VFLLLMVEHLSGSAPVDGVRAGNTHGSQDALNPMAAAVACGEGVAGVARIDEARCALVLVREHVVAGGTDKMSGSALYVGNVRNRFR